LWLSIETDGIALGIETMAGKRDCVNGNDKYASDTALQFTLREMHALLGKPAFWLVLAAVTLIAAFSGPFSTIDDLTLAKRFAYWGSIVVLTGIIATATATFVPRWLDRFKPPMLVSAMLAALAASIPVTLIVWFITRHVAGLTDNDPLHFSPNTVPITIVVVLAYQLLARNRELPQEIAPTEIRPAFFDRLPVALGRDLYSLQAQDHYVQAVTARGSEMVLVRLEDAIRELAPLEGLRVHRSWWVAKNAVSAIRRADGKLVITLKDGREVQVSRSYAKDAREMFPAP
jgi:DNA-binding LytR/AlgR family response regulator